MKDFLNGLKFWGRPLILVAVSGVAGFLMFTATTAAIWGPAIPITIIAGVLAGFDIHHHLAQRHYLIKKSGPNSEENYKKELRRLTRMHREAVRKTFSYKNYGSGNTYFNEALELEKRIEAHKNGEEYPPKAVRNTRSYDRY
jgi:hypothetical protein